MEPITHKDLDESLEKQEKRIEKLFEAKLEPVIKNLERHEKTLFGKDGSGGLVRAVIILNWGYGLGAIVLGILIHKIFIL